MPGLTRYRRRILTTFPAAVFSDQIKSGVTGREYTYATRSFIGASGFGGGAGGIGLAGVAGAAGAVEGGGVTRAAGIAGLPGAGRPEAVEGGGATTAAGATGLPAAGPPGALAGAGAILAARRTTGLPAARPPGAVAGGGATMAAGITRPPGAGGGGGITVVASTTELSGAGSAGGIDGISPFRCRSGISAGFSTDGTLTSAAGFGLGAVSWRRRFGWDQHGTFFAVEADCAPITPELPWVMAARWLDLLARSGTPLFVSADPRATGPEQKAAIQRAFAVAARPGALAEPLDWLATATPRRWLLQGKPAEFDWFGAEGATPFPK